MKRSRVVTMEFVCHRLGIKMFDREEYKKQYDKQYYLDNKEWLLEKCKKWKINNPERYRKYRKQYDEDHKEERAKYFKQYRINNLEHIKQYDKDHRGQINKIARQHQKEKQKYVDDLKLSKGCSVCGYNKCAEALEFHHNGDKKFSIAMGVRSRRALMAVKKEIEKCNILCANCHAELHKKKK